MRWEYKIVHLTLMDDNTWPEGIPAGQFESGLSALGAAGWAFVAVLHSGPTVETLLFQRPIPMVETKPATYAVAVSGLTRKPNEQ